jgi:hypothetical protein
MAKHPYPGLVEKGEIKTALGNLEINSVDCVDSVDILISGEVWLDLKLNHKSEDLEMSMRYRLSPEDARILAGALADAADDAESSY